MAGGLDMRRGKRVTMGLAPAWYDRYERLEVDEVTDRLIYSVRENDDALRVVGIVEIVYTDSSKCKELSAERLVL